MGNSCSILSVLLPGICQTELRTLGGQENGKFNVICRFPPQILVFCGKWRKMSLFRCCASRVQLHRHLFSYEIGLLITVRSRLVWHFSLLLHHPPKSRWTTHSRFLDICIFAEGKKCNILHPSGRGRCIIDIIEEAFCAKNVSFFCIRPRCKREGVSPGIGQFVAKIILWRTPASVIKVCLGVMHEYFGTQVLSSFIFRAKTCKFKRKKSSSPKPRFREIGVSERSHIFCCSQPLFDLGSKSEWTNEAINIGHRNFLQSAER